MRIYRYLELMKHVILILLFLGLGYELQAQTTIAVLGTLHLRSARFNPDSILEVMNRFKPDVILMELDTSLMDGQGNLKGRAISIDQNEEVAMKQYKNVNPVVQIRRFDIEYRNHYYESHKTFATEAQLDKAVDSLWKNNGLSRESMQIISTLNRVSSAIDILADMGITSINSKEYKQMAEFRQNWMYKKRLAVIAHTPALHEYYDFYKDDGEFWDIRNKRMIINIANYAKVFKGKKILVLTGAMHTYYLTIGLKPLQTGFDFKLVDPPLSN